MTYKSYVFPMLLARDIQGERFEPEEELTFADQQYDESARKAKEDGKRQ